MQNHFHVSFVIQDEQSRTPRLHHLLHLVDEILADPGSRILFSLFIATAMSISAMPVIAKILVDLDLTKRNIGIVILSAGVVDDTVGWLVLSLIAGAATRGAVPPAATS